VDELWTVDLGLMPYREAHALQHRVREARQADVIPDTVLFVEHPPVYTRGRRSEPGELPFGEDWYAERGIEIVQVERGGKVTYHGPGQLIAYPIVRVDDVVQFVSDLERAIVLALADEGIENARARSNEGREFAGVWVDQRKIASIGLHISHGVTMHGLAVNVTNDLTPFEWIVPCGLGGVAMTSVAAELGEGAGNVGVPCHRKRLGHRLAEVLGRRQRLVPPARLERVMQEAAASVN
jgi:lipoyl(octanoyl) transferase